MSDGDREALLGLLYEGPLQTRPWHGFLHGLCEWACLSGASITLWESDLEPISTFVLASAPDDVTDWAAVERDYYQHHADLDPVGTERVGLWEVRCAITAELPPSERDFAATYGISHFGRACFPGSRNSKAWLEFFRRDPDHAFEPECIARMRDLLPHLSRSLRIHQRLMQQRVEHSLHESSGEHISVGTLILNGYGEVIYRNGAAQTLMAEVPVIQLVNDRPVLSDRSKQREFRLAIERLIHCSAAQIESSERFVVALGHGDRQFGLLARDVHNSPWFKGRHTPHVAIYMVEIGCEPGIGGAASLNAVSLLSRLLGLTRQEARTALLMSDDTSISDVGAALNVAEATARNYSKRIYQKLGVSRRSDLVRVVQRSLALLR